MKLTTKLRELMEKATQGEWELWDSCSWRRIGIKNQFNSRAQILEPTIASDGHPDLSTLLV